MEKLGIIVGIALACGVSQAQLLNGDFEAGSGTDADSWTESTAAKREPWANHGGAQGMSFQWWNGLTGDFYQDVTANAASTYTLSAWFLDDAPAVATSVYTMNLVWLDNATNAISTNTLNLSPLLNNVWQQLSLTNIAPAGTVKVRVLFDGDFMVSGETLKIDDVTLTFTAPPGAPDITGHPAHKTVSAGANTTFTVVVSNPSGVTYQWQKDGADIANGGSISGATSQTLTVTGVSAGDVGHYRVRATNVTGSDTSEEASLQIVGINFYPVVKIDGKIGDTNIVEYATALAPTTWIPFATNVLTTSPQYVIDPASAGSNTRFYRAIYQP